MLTGETRIFSNLTINAIGLVSTWSFAGDMGPKELLISWIIRVVTSGTSDRSMVSQSPLLYLNVVSSFVFCSNIRNLATPLPK